MKKALAIVAIVLLVLFLSAGVWWHEMNVLPDVSIPALPLSSPNAYDYFVAARKLDKDSSKWNAAVTNRPSGYKSTWTGRWAADDRQYSLSEKEALLRENLPALAKAREGFQYPFAGPRTVGPIYAKLREVSRMIAFSGQVY